MFAVIQIQYLAITQKPVINKYTITSSGFEFIPENPWNSEFKRMCI